VAVEKVEDKDCLDELPLQLLVRTGTTNSANEVITVIVEPPLETRTTTLVSTALYTFAEGVVYSAAENSEEIVSVDDGLTNITYELTANYEVTGTSGVVVAAVKLVSRSNGVDIINTFQGSVECPDGTLSGLSESSFNLLLQTIGIH